MDVERARDEDLREILPLQRRAFAGQAELYDDPSMPPMIETLEEFREEFPRLLVLKAVEGGGIVGSVRGRYDFVENGTCFVERLVVEPEFEGRGVGTALMVELERGLPEAERFELFTGHRSERSLALYERLGYRRYREERQTDALTFVFMEKSREFADGTRGV